MIQPGILLPFMIMLPLVAGVLIIVFRYLPRRVFDAAGMVVTAALVLGSAALAEGVSKQGVVMYRFAEWMAPAGTIFVIDGFSAFILLIINALFLLLMIYSSEFMERFKDKWQYFALVMFMLAGLNGVLVSGDFFTLFVFVEMTGISAYALTAFERRAENFEASLKYAVLGTLSSMMVLLAMALIYAQTASLSLSAIALSWQQGLSPLGISVTILLLVGFGLKASLIPFHAWVPDAYSSAPAPVSAAFSGTLSKVLGVYLLARFFFNILGVTLGSLNLLAILGLVSILGGVTLAFYQWDFKRLLAYHSISQLGYIMLGLGLGTPLGIMGALFHLLNHSVFKPLLFLNAGSVEYATGERDLKKMGGIAQKMPVTGATSLIASLSISGVPPFNGFWSKLIIIIACVQAGRIAFSVIAVVGSILTLVSFMKVQRYAFYGFLKDSFADLKEAPLAMTLPMLILALGCVFLGVILLPWPGKNILELALEALLRGKEFATIIAGTIS